MDYLASYTLLPLRFAGNQMNENVESPTASNRASLLYRLDIYRPEAFQSGNFILHESLRGRESPPTIQNGVTLYEGCNFDLHEFVWGLLSPTPPAADQAQITLQANATLPIYTRKWVDPLQSTTETISPINYIVRGKLSTEQFPLWKETFFTDYLLDTKGFLSWQPVTAKIIDRNQPEFLNFLVHHYPAPSRLFVRVEVEFSDGTKSETLTPISLEKVYNFGLYTIPVGFTPLDLSQLETEEKQVIAYTVWVSNQALEQLTCTRRYIVNNDYQPYARHLVFLNSLGGWDTIRCIGVSSEALQTTSTAYQRQLEANYTPSSEEIFVTNVIGEKRLVVNTGHLSAEWLEYLEELQWSEKVYVNTNEGLVPIILAQNTYESGNDEETFGGRTFTFKRSKQEVAYSRMPVPEQNSNRPTQWVGIGPYCVVNSQGLRTGFQSFSLLELRYLDGSQERVLGVNRKPNTPDTEGYIAPLISASCLTTPYINVEISRQGTIKRNNCANGLFGTTATITVAAGTHGSETSQAEAQARAEATWTALNTQTAANEGGSCVLLYKSAAISRLSTLSRNNCGNGLAGPKWTIIVPAEQFTSEISQADADAQATSYANSLDTQANANLYGGCGYVNVAQTKTSTFKRNSCTGGMVGSGWSISVEAGRFYSALSQADADAQATADIQLRDTQANANLYGSCRFESVCVAKTTTFLIQSGANAGRPLTVWFSKGTFTSVISQADADAIVEAHFQANYNLQSVVNNYGNLTRENTDYCTWNMYGQVTLQVRN